MDWRRKGGEEFNACDSRYNLTNEPVCFHYNDRLLLRNLLTILSFLSLVNCENTAAASSSHIKHAKSEFSLDRGLESSEDFENAIRYVDVKTVETKFSMVEENLI